MIELVVPVIIYWAIIGVIMIELVVPVIIYWAIMGVIMLVMSKHTVKYHELAHAQTAKKYVCNVFMVFSDSQKGKTYVDQINGIDAYHLTKEQYEEHFNKSSVAKAFHALEIYDNNAVRITLAGPLDTTKRMLLYGVIAMVLLKLLEKCIINHYIQGLLNYEVITIPYMIILYILTELLLCYFSAWHVPFKSLEKYENAVKYRIENKKPDDKKKPIGLGLSDGTKLLFRKRVAKLMDIMYSSENRDWFLTYDDVLKQMKELIATDRGTAEVDAT